MTNPVKWLAVKTVKPLVSPRAWSALKGASVKNEPPTQEAAAPRPVDLGAMTLTELAQHFRTDKWGVHRYTPHYERQFAHLRDQQFTLLEIGVGGYRRDGRGGASLRAWKHYFPMAEIIGLDIEDKSFVDEERIRTYRGDQTDPDVLLAMAAEAGEIKVVIDDGSHVPEHIRATFAVLFPLLADDGIYVIEDLQTSYWPEWGGNEDVHDRSTSMALVKDLLDGLNYEERVDESYQPTYTDLHVVAVHAYHNLVFIQKGMNHEGTNRRTVLHERYAGTSASSDGSQPGHAESRST